LPPGLSGTSAGVISGIPTAAGTYTVQIDLSDSAGARDTRSIPLTISAVPLAVTTTSLPNAKVRQFYSVTVSATGGTPPYTFEFGNGIGTTLPPGLNGTQSGIISGTPTAAGNFSVQITVLDSFGAITTKAVNLSVLP
jgi:large repetitive protein